MNLEPVNVGLLGLGTVGGGTVNVLLRNAEEIARRAGRGIRVTHASARDLKKSRICPVDGIKLSTDPQELVNNPDIAIVVELIGGIEPARELVLAAIANGKHVVTANKALIAIHGNAIFEAAQRQGLMVGFEAAVAGGIPVIKALREALAGNRIEWICGIINGTGNFILSEMLDQGRDFSEVLAEAQHLGYAEADPALDVEGVDAAHKLTIMAAVAFGIPLQFDKVYTEGITHITPEDINSAEQLGYRIKHLGIAKRHGHGIELRVHLTLIPKRRLIANVSGVMNAIVVKGDAAGPTLYYGAGAGAEPTASAVVADLVDVVRTLNSDADNRVPHLAFQPGTLANTPILPMDEVETAYYLRMQAIDKPGVLADIARILGDKGISIEAVIQPEPSLGEGHVPLIMLVQKIKEKHLNDAMVAIQSLAAIDGDVTRIRLEPLV